MCPSLTLSMEKMTKLTTEYDDLKFSVMIEFRMARTENQLTNDYHLIN